ncbi:MAG TPA: hypothetical protein VGL35_01420 [Rhizomicrobium sp.]
MRFVIIASPRTGSSLLVDVLGRHPKIFCNGNALHPRHLWLFWPKSELPSPLKDDLCALREKNPEEFLERLYNANFGKDHVGFKIFNGQNNPMLRKMIDDAKIRKIVLYRKNVLASFASAQAARSDKQWSVSKGTSSNFPPKIQFDEAEFVPFHDKYISYYQKVMRRLGKRNQPFHFLEYADINDSLLIANVVSFIGADPALLSRKADDRSRHMKQNSPDILSRFTNAAEIEAFLSRNNLLHWAYEGETSIAPLATGHERRSNSIDIHARERDSTSIDDVPLQCEPTLAEQSR